MTTPHNPTPAPSELAALLEEWVQAEVEYAKANAEYHRLIGLPGIKHALQEQRTVCTRREAARNNLLDAASREAARRAKVRP